MKKLVSPLGYAWVLLTLLASTNVCQAGSISLKNRTAEAVDVLLGAGPTDAEFKTLARASDLPKKIHPIGTKITIGAGSSETLTTDKSVVTISIALPTGVSDDNQKLTKNDGTLYTPRAEFSYPTIGQHANLYILDPIISDKESAHFVIETATVAAPKTTPTATYERLSKPSSSGFIFEQQVATPKGSSGFLFDVENLPKKDSSSKPYLGRDDSNWMEKFRKEQEETRKKAR